MMNKTCLRTQLDITGVNAKMLIASYLRGLLIVAKAMNMKTMTKPYIRLTYKRHTITTVTQPKFLSNTH